MIIKNTLLAVTLIFLSIQLNAQVKGNYDYRADANLFYQPPVKAQQASPRIPLRPLGDLTFSIKGLYNATADSYLAIFTTTQVGVNQKETNDLLRTKIEAIRKKLKEQSPETKMYVDMISFMPLYEVVKEKRRFSKTTYNEIPMGFELKKNLHFKYSDPAILEALVSICSENEIYDLVKVDYFIENMDKKRAELIAKAEVALKKKIARYGALMGNDFADKNRILADGFAVHYPLEQYKTYTAYCSNALSFSKTENVKTYQKVSSQFYMPLANRGYDFVINTSILEPVVQVEYEIQIKLVDKPLAPIQAPPVKEVVKTKIVKEVYFVTPEGKINKLNL
jgi:hypothetical protein